MPEAAPPGSPLCVRAPAKVNVYLEVLGRRPDGYHDLYMVMQAVSLFDELSFTQRSDGAVTLSCDRQDLGDPDKNLVVRAARALQEHCGVRRGADITLCKQIPVGGGLGGGSSDGAVTLLALAHLWGLDVPPDELEDLAAGLGSDAAFFIRGGAAVCEGKGERITAVACARPIHYVIVAPPCHSSTAEVYRAWRSGLTGRDVTRMTVLEALNHGDIGLLAASLRNDLQEAALGLQPELQQFWSRLKEAMAVHGLTAFQLTGSGACFLVVVDGEREAACMAKRLSAALGIPCHAVHSLPAWNGSILPLTSGRGHR